ncbi:hypothetical protein [Psychromonas aquatilis]|uniref:TM2 domain-containing protein n=1 Tax=Psychromonas aquatilis TaxID=2005072 RepID=A0ABU9GQX0_9GAMM
MKKILKAILLNAFVVPGAGHFLYQRTISGIVFAMAFIIPLGVLFSTLLVEINQLILQIQNGYIPFDINEITLAVSELLSNKQQTMNTCTYIMAGSWLLSIVDTYRISRAQNTPSI